jgi:hypothetical protein
LHKNKELMDKESTLVRGLRPEREPFQGPSYQQSAISFPVPFIRESQKPYRQFFVDMKALSAYPSRIVLLLPYGSIGVCVAIILGSFISRPLGMRYAMRLTGLGLGTQVREEAPALGATLAMVVALLAIQGLLGAHLPAWTAIAAFMAAGVGVYVAALALISRADLIALYQLLKKVGIIFSRGGPLQARDEDEDGAAAVAE